MESSSLQIIAQAHRLQEELFLRHQEALLAGDLTEAARLLAVFVAALRRHAASEDEVLMPLYEPLPHEHGATPRVFTGEHRKLERFLDRMTAKLAVVAGPRDLIALFDLASRFKGLMEHHSDREERALFPTLDAALDEPARRQALVPFLAQEQALRRAMHKQVAAHNTTLD